MVCNVEFKIRIDDKSDPGTENQGHDVDLTIKWLQMEI